MGVSTYMIGMIKTKTKGFCKETIEELTNNCPEYFYLVLRRKPMIPGGRPITNTGCKYNTQEHKLRHSLFI